MDAKELIDELNKRIDYAKENNYDLDAASWAYEEGCLMSYNDVQVLLDQIKSLNSIGDKYASFFMDVMDGIKPDEAAKNNHL